MYAHIQILQHACHVTLSCSHACNPFRTYIEAHSLRKWAEVFTVARRALTAVVQQMDQTPAMSSSLLYSGALRGRTFCSGIGAIEEATRQLAEACRRLNEDSGCNLDFQPSFVSLCDSNATCQKFLLKGTVRRRMGLTYPRMC